MGAFKKVCLITPNHISSDPRLVKEAIALERHGYGVHLVFTQNLAYLADRDLAILQTHPQWTYSVLDWTGNSLQSQFRRFYSGFLLKLSSIFTRYRTPIFLSCITLNRHFLWQLRAAKKASADLYIAHNLGALPVAVFAARALEAKAGFDAEDFHRQEESDVLDSPEVVNKMVIENRFIPLVSHFTAASPLIGEAYSKLYPEQEQPITLLNVFPRTKLSRKEAEKKSSVLRLFWFSQTVGRNRGIEDVIQAITACSPGIELHLLGSCSETDKQFFYDLLASYGGCSQCMYFYPPIPETEIFALANRFDVGLATETGVPYNREICLTNKIFTYIQSGLAVVASDTLAQRKLLHQYNNVGFLYPKGSVSGLARVLRHYVAHPDLLKAHKVS
ncbi:MAG: hypothetical protein EOO01_31495, partial [Chitinophagaceae bacterium]